MENISLILEKQVKYFETSYCYTTENIVETKKNVFNSFWESLDYTTIWLIQKPFVYEQGRYSRTRCRYPSRMIHLETALSYGPQSLKNMMYTSGGTTLSSSSVHS